jgi:ABC-2 type transport system permease protein
MQSRTSFFNKAVFGKSISRFWPIWAIYLGLWVLVLPVTLLSRRWEYGGWGIQNAASFILESGIFGGVLGGAVLAVAVCMAVWCFLYNNRGAHGMACLPLRREGLFCSVMLAGLLPAWAVQLCVAVLAWLAGAVSGLGGSGAQLAGYLAQWFGTVALTYLFFYGFATLCAMLTGNVVILLLVYGVLNFVAVGVELLIRGVFAQFVYGLAGSIDVLPVTRWISPAVGYLTTLGLDYGMETVTMHGWTALWLYALAGLVLLVCALLLFRRRRIESAGDVVAVRVLKPIFRWCMALGCGMVLSSLIYTIFFYNYGNGQTRGAFLITLIFLLIGALIGWFAGEMLICKSFRVFSGRRWAGYGIVCAVILVVMLGMRFDLFGVERRVPETAEVKSVLVTSAGTGATLTTPEGIDQARELHRAILADRSWNDRATYYESSVNSTFCNIRYTLRSGAVVSRQYVLYYEEADPHGRGECGLLQDLMNCPDAVANRKRINGEVTRERVLGGWVETTMPAGEAAALEGYDRAEDYLICEYLGYSRSDVALMSETERRSLAVEAACQSMLNYRYGDAYLYTYYDRNFDPERTDFDSVLVLYSLHLGAGEAWDLWEQAVRDDLAEGRLGRVYLLNDDSFATGTYLTHVGIEFRDVLVGQLEDVNGNFLTASSELSTTVTVDARRTADWLRARGLELVTPAEAQNDVPGR